MRRTPLEEGQRWLAQAEEDLKWTQDLANRGGYHIACFLAQQVGEKAIKAFIYAQGEEIVLGHSVERLCSDASHWNPAFAESAKRWAVLYSYYIPTRYPNGLPDSIPAKVFTEDAAKNAASLAEQIVFFVRNEMQTAINIAQKDQARPSE